MYSLTACLVTLCAFYVFVSALSSVRFDAAVTPTLWHAPWRWQFPSLVHLGAKFDGCASIYDKDTFPELQDHAQRILRTVMSLLELGPAEVELPDNPEWPLCGDVGARWL